MIDDRELRHRQIMTSIFGPHDDVEIILHARRYLVLRKHGVLMGMPHDLKLVSDGDLDATADRLLEGGK